jgi:hypothetical protein
VQRWRISNESEGAEMPSKTKKQAKFMAAVAHGWKPSKRKAPPVAVAKEFNTADKAKRRK